MTVTGAKIYLFPCHFLQAETHHRKSYIIICELPFFLCTAAHSTIYHRIQRYQMSVLMLQNLCRKFNLKPKGRKKQAYIEILTEFSQRKEAWMYVAP